MELRLKSIFDGAPTKFIFCEIQVKSILHRARVESILYGVKLYLNGIPKALPTILAKKNSVPIAPPNSGPNVLLIITVEEMNVNC